MPSIRPNPFKVLNASEEELEKMIDASRELSWKHFGKKIWFYAPSFTHYRSFRFRSSPNFFPSISVTGNSCALKCKHCQGKILKSMIPALTPAELIEICRALKAKGCVGFLISGGCLPDGSVPLERFAEAFAYIKQDLGLKIVAHTGLTNIRVARKLKEAGVDAALIDVIGSDETIREVYQLNARVEDYDKSLKALYESGISMVPHVLVGLHHGKIKGEFQAIKMISKYDPSAVIVIALTPISGTPMENVAPPKPWDILRTLIAARFMMPSAPLVLGCVRPKGEHRAETDMLAVKAGVNAIAFPSEDAVQLADSMDLVVSFSSLCCSQIFEEFKR
jgi:hypothetical protein